MLPTDSLKWARNSSGIALRDRDFILHKVILKRYPENQLIPLINCSSRCSLSLSLSLTLSLSVVVLGRERMHIPAKHPALSGICEGAIESERSDKKSHWKRYVVRLVCCVYFFDSIMKFTFILTRKGGRGTAEIQARAPDKQGSLFFCSIASSPRDLDLDFCCSR